VSTLFWITYVAAWTLLVVLLLLVLLLYRQYGLTYMGPRRRIDLGGRDLGSTAPPVVVRQGSGVSDLEVSWRDLVTRDSTHVVFALFASPTCPICEGLFAEVGQVADRWTGVEFLWFDRESRLQVPPRGWRVLLSDDASQTMEIPAFPYAYVLNGKGRIETKGLVNSTGDINRLITGVLGKSATGDHDHALDITAASK